MSVAVEPDPVEQFARSMRKTKDWMRVINATWAVECLWQRRGVIGLYYFGRSSTQDEINDANDRLHIIREYYDRTHTEGTA